jgi:alginate O-acetyltransferase complex protein AlgI
MLAAERTVGKDSFYRRLPGVARVAVTFLIVSLAWVFFRAYTLGGAVDYLLSLAGLGPQTASADLLAGVMYNRYHLLTLAMAALLVWTAPQVWAFTCRLTPARAALCMVLLAVSVLFMWTQTDNPFLYFQF